MQSINDHRVRHRVSLIRDTFVASQADQKGMEGYLKPMLKDIGADKESMGSASDFNRQIGSI